MGDLFRKRRFGRYSRGGTIDVEFLQNENEIARSRSRMVSRNFTIQSNIRGSRAAIHRRHFGTNLGGVMHDSNPTPIMEIFKEQKSEASMKRLMDWALGLTLTGWSALYQFKVWFLNQGINLGMALTIFILTVVWWLHRIRKERLDAENSEMINRSLKREEHESLERLKEKATVKSLKSNKGKQQKPPDAINN